MCTSNHCMLVLLSNLVCVYRYRYVLFYTQSLYVIVLNNIYYVIHITAYCFHSHKWFIIRQCSPTNKPATREGVTKRCKRKHMKRSSTKKWGEWTREKRTKKKRRKEDYQSKRRCGEWYAWLAAPTERGLRATHKESRLAERRRCLPVPPPAPSTTSLISFCGAGLLLLSGLCRAQQSQVNMSKVENFTSWSRYRSIWKPAPNASTGVPPPPGGLSVGEM